MNSPRKFGQVGQAMTEMNIVGAFVLVPLMLSLPILAKYIDIEIAMVQAARYQAWEYTVWYNDQSERTAGFTQGNAPVKTLSDAAGEAEVRFFGREDQPLDQGDANGLTGESQLKAYWQDHRGQSLVVYQNNLLDPDDAIDGSTPSLPVMGDVADLLFEGFDAVTSLLADVMGLIGSDVGFTVIELDRYANTTMTLRTTDFGIFEGDTSNPLELTHSASASVLTESWNAGGGDHVSNQVKGLVPTGIIGQLWESFVSLPGISTIWDVITFFLPEFSTDCLQFGYIEPDNVPPDRLDSGGTVECDSGLCAFDPDPTPEEPLDVCGS